MPSPDLRAEARHLYGSNPVGYESGRPDYPGRVYEILAARCGLAPGVSVVEIGPGTGRVTRRLTELGATVVAVEPDARMAAYLREVMTGASVDVRNGAFEEVALPENYFDLAVAAMSFHWVDQDRGLERLARVVKSGGWVALWWTLFGDPSRPDPFHEATRDLLDQFDTKPTPPLHVPFELDVAGWKNALADRAGLIDVGAELIHWTARFDPTQLRAFYASTIRVLRRPEQEQRAILETLETHCAMEFGGLVERPFVTAMYTARRP